MSNTSKNGSTGRPTGTSNAALAARIDGLTARVDQLEKSNVAFRSLLTELLTQQAVSQAAPQMLAQMKQQIHQQIEATGLENIASGAIPGQAPPQMMQPPPVAAQPPVG
jgi:hypothetical protein